jgi:excisionase family DNA binding protein
MERKLLTIEEVARLLGVSTSTVRRWITSGKLEGQKAGAQWRFDRDSLNESFEQGVLSGGSRQVSLYKVKRREFREDERVKIMQWKRKVVDYLERTRPSHVIAVDRRGAKLWEAMGIEGYTWGRNLWHSTVIEQMLPPEQRKLFDQRTVLLFDDLLQRGRTMHQMRNKFRSVGANVLSLVCVRNTSSAEKGKIIETEAFVCEDVDESNFSDRVTLISHLVSIFDPPLDVDHLIVKTKLASGLTVEEMLDRMSKWGHAFIVWYPSEKQEYFALTLDRPQFLDINSISVPEGFSVDWAAPCKVRFYVLPEKRICYCSFIAYPEIEATEETWKREIIRSYKDSQATLPDSSWDPATEREGVRAAYYRLCMDIAMKIFDDFVTSRAAEDIGICMENSIDAIDVRHLKAAFGPTLGIEINKRATETLGRAKFIERFSSRTPKHRVPLWIREYSEIQGRNYDAFTCRVDLLRVIPQRPENAEPATELAGSVSYSELFNRLPEYAESTIGKTLDNELDKATIKPVVRVVPSEGNVSYINVSRGFTRGEFGIWFELYADSQSYDDKAMQRALTLGPIVVEDYLRRMRKTEMTATEFNKLFANIEHDWRSQFDTVYLGWTPYKFGPIPIIPEASASGQYLFYHRFLVDKEALSKREEKHGSKIWTSYGLNATSEIPWGSLYKKKMTPETRAYVKQLVRIYTKIQQDFKTERSSDPRSSGISTLHDSIVVLATARNEETAYRCGWFEFNDWKSRGRTLFSHLEGAALQDCRPKTPYMKKYLDEFAAPAAILFDKIEMYRNLPQLRKQIEGLVDQDGFEVAEVVLEKIDATPRFSSNSKYPIRNLEYADEIMRTFSSMTRQILTQCGLDVDEREEIDKKNADGSPRNARFYLNELLDRCPELTAAKSELEKCIASADRGVLTEEMNDCLSKVYHHILKNFEKQKLIPDPRPNSEIDREMKQRQDGLISRLQGIQISGPYAVSVADIYNLKNLPEIGRLFNVSYEDAVDSLLKWVGDCAETAIRDHNGIALRTADNIIMAAPDADELYVAYVDFQKKAHDYVYNSQHGFASFALLQTGIAWHEDSLGEEFAGLKPGKIAIELAGAQAAGTISITKAVYDRLSPSHQRAFVRKCGSCGQGEVFMQQWKSGE